jgi:GDP-mannose 6-dehydrogenase
LLAEQVAQGRLRATANVAEAIRETRVALICVGTPSSSDGAVNSQAVERVVESIGQALRGTDRDYTVVIRSTLLPGILEETLAPRLSASAGCELGPRLDLCNNPEFLRESCAIKDYDDPPYVLVGAQNPSTSDTVLALYEKIDAEKIVTDPSAAALVKYACNAYHAVKVCFANEIGSLARALGTDGQEVMRLVCKDKKLNISPAYLRPGFAFGGSCLPKDVRALVRYAQQQALRVDLLDATLSSNEAHLRRAIRLVEESGCRRIGLVGLSFKAGTDDLRESPQVILAESLLGRGYDLQIFDPGVAMSRLHGRNLAYVDQHLPHLAALLVQEARDISQHAELLILATSVGDHFPWNEEFAGKIIDLRRDLVVASSASHAVSQDRNLQSPKLAAIR